MQMLALGCVKLSFLFFYRRVFTIGTSTCFSKITFGMIIIVLLWTAAFFFALLFACKGNWSAWLSLDVDLSTKCGNALQFELGMATSDFVTDVLIMVLPIPMIWRLHMSTKRKLAVTGIFLLGAVATAASIVRMVQFIHAYIQVVFDHHADADLLSHPIYGHQEGARTQRIVWRKSSLLGSPLSASSTRILLTRLMWSASVQMDEDKKMEVLSGRIRVQRNIAQVEDWA
ncbi:MAG: hypothetical protein Q9228_002240 [Teloschistes exilis]